MADSQKDSPIAPRRTLGGPILPPPPPELIEEAEQAKVEDAKAQESEAQKQSLKEAQKASREERLAARDAEKARRAEEAAQEKARQKAAKQEQKAAKSRPPKPVTACERTRTRSTVVASTARSPPTVRCAKSVTSAVVWESM